MPDQDSDRTTAGERIPIPKNYDVEDYGTHKVGGERTTIRYEKRKPRKVVWHRLNLRGDVECQLCGMVAMSRNGVLLHERYEHSGDIGLEARIDAASITVDSLYDMFEALPKEPIHKLRWFGPKWWRDRKK